MKRILFILVSLMFISFSNNVLHAQNIGINADGSTPDINAMLDIKASNKGLLIPRTSTTSRTAIPATKGLLVYDTTLASFWYNDGANWQQISNGSELDGTLNYLPKFTGINTIGNSQIIDNGLSISMGFYSTATGNGSFAEGIYANATGENSIALGQNVTASGPNSVVFGYVSKADGRYSFSAGYDNVANNESSVAMGAGVKSSGVASVALGNGSVASGYTSTATGFQTTAAADFSTAMGNNTTAGGKNSFVWGLNSNTSGANSIVLGTNLFDGGHKGNAMLGDTDPWNAGSVGSGSDNQMICRFNNGYYFLTGGNTNRSGMIANHGDNSWSTISDSTKKEKLIPVNGEELLKKISNFKLTTWNYKGQDPKVFRHYGPMAQDFHNAFGHDAVGTIGNDTLINQADFLGVSFTAIQALEKRTERIEEQQQQIENLQKQNATLSASNEKLQQQLQTLLMSVAAMDKKVEALASVENKTNALAKK